MSFMKASYLLIVGLFLPSLFYAQDLPTGEIQDVQVIIEKDKPLTLPSASRLYQKTDIRRIEEDTATLNYTISLPQYSFESFSPTFQPKAFREKNTVSKSQNYVKGAYGNYQSPLLETYAELSERLNYLGLWYQHESYGKGPVRGSESGYATNRFSLDGKYVARYFEFEPILNFRREGFYYYGYDFESLQSSVGADYLHIQDRAIFNSWSAGGTISTLSKKDFKMSFTPVYESTSMKFKKGDSYGRDNVVSLLSEASYDVSDKMNLSLGLGYDWAQYDGTESLFNRSKAYFNPALNVVRKDFYLSAGLSLIASKDSVSAVNIYPDVYAKYFLSDKFSISLKVDGDLEMNTLESLFDRNTYLDDSLAILNSNRKLSVKSTFGAKLSDRLIVEASLGYDAIENQPLFTNAAVGTDTSRYSIIYDDNFGRFNFGLKASYLIESRTSLELLFDYYAYKEGSISEAWFMPTSKLEFSANHNFTKKLSTSLNLIVLGGMKAPLQPIVGDALFVQPNFKNLDPIIDLGLRINYSIKENIEAFATVDNIFNKEYEYYTNFPSRGVVAKMGFIFRF